MQPFLPDRQRSNNDGYSTARDDLTPQDYLAFAKQWQALSATIIGGCCGIGPEHIALLDALKD
ncbi:homocysteine S-methyltransferase family protein [Pseudomonadales bacterium]|nr:homocysteine S-methyltransferase family protein [Pseudomonadales bacterium]